MFFKIVNCKKKKNIAIVKPMKCNHSQSHDAYIVTSSYVKAI